MYEQFFGFKEKPFTLLPDPAFLYLGKMHSTAYAMLEYGMHSQASFTVITGEVGSGKTTLIRHLLNQLDEDVTVGLVNSSHREMGELLRWIMLSFGLDYREKDKVSLHDKFTQFLIDQYAKNLRTVLIIDEAQNLEVQILEELRLLSNINADKNQVLQIILVGQPELRDLLKKPELLQFIQRVSVDYHLSALSEDEVNSYIYHRTRCAGSIGPVFSKNASSMIYVASKGIPRVINMLCDMTLVYAFVDQKKVVSAAIVKSVLADKADSGLFPSEKNEKEQQVTVQGQSDAVKSVQVSKKFDRAQARELFRKFSEKD